MRLADREYWANNHHLVEPGFILRETLKKPLFLENTAL